MNRAFQAQPTSKAQVKSVPVLGKGNLLQRKCACGGAAGLEGECAACAKKKQALQRKADQDQFPASSGRTLEPARQQNSGQRVSHDFSQIRVYAGPTAKPAERNVNGAGLPDPLKAGLEQLSGLDLSAVQIHYNATEPAQVNALAYTQGTDIRIAPGQARHLPHEGWHVVQQLQGRVKPTMQMKGTLVNDHDELEREADVMGAKAKQLGDQAGKASFQTRLATTGEAEPEDEPFVVALASAVQQSTRQLVKPPLGKGPVMQRVANFVAGTVNATTNLAAHVIAGNRDMGFTPPTLNGTTILSGATAQGALKAPVLGGRSNADGTESTWVSTVPTNEASFTMRLPAAGPWSTVTPKANVVALFASLRLTAQAGCATAGDSTFGFNGKPTDADFATNVRTHEDIHAADHKTAFNTVIVAWDTKLEAAKTANRVFSGATVADAEAALFRAMGGTPNQIATAQFAEWIRLNNITHRGATLATGGTATPSNSAANATCTTSSIDAT